MQVEKIKVGPLRTNCYIISNNANEVLIVDPGAEFEKIKFKVDGRSVLGVLITHEHYDHIGALDEVISTYGCKVNEYNFFSFNFEVIKVPGHRFDSKAFYFKEYNFMITGDFIFKGTFGRVDLPGSNVNDMINSLSKIKKYPEDTIIYPGHGDDTLLKYKDINSYINYFL